MTNELIAALQLAHQQVKRAQHSMSSLERKLPYSEGLEVIAGIHGHRSWHDYREHLVSLYTKTVPSNLCTMVTVSLHCEGSFMGTKTYLVRTPQEAVHEIIRTNFPTQYLDGLHPDTPVLLGMEVLEPTEQEVVTWLVEHEVPESCVTGYLCKLKGPSYIDEASDIPSAERRYLKRVSLLKELAGGPLYISRLKEEFLLPDWPYDYC